MEPRKRRNTYRAPIGSVDLPAFDEDGEPYEIRPCSFCLPWYVEVHFDDDGGVFVREWHAVECVELEEMLHLHGGPSDSSPD
jgi:hypothetical protein